MFNHFRKRDFNEYLSGLLGSTAHNTVMTTNKETGCKGKRTSPKNVAESLNILSTYKTSILMLVQNSYYNENKNCFLFGYCGHNLLHVNDAKLSSIKLSHTTKKTCME
jgi:hypothetical protein